MVNPLLGRGWQLTAMPSLLHFSTETVPFHSYIAMRQRYTVLVFCVVLVILFYRISKCLVSCVIIGKTPQPFQNFGQENQVFAEGRF